MEKEAKFKVGDKVYFMFLNLICCSKVKSVEHVTDRGEDFNMYELEQREKDSFEESLLFPSLDAIVGHLVQNIMVAKDT